VDDVLDEIALTTLAGLLVAVAAAASWTPNRDTLVGRSLNTPLIGRALPGVVRLTLVNGVVAWEASGD